MPETSSEGCTDWAALIWRRGPAEHSPACHEHWPEAASTGPASTPGVPNTPPGDLRRLQPAWPLQLELPVESEAPSAAATPLGHCLARIASPGASDFCSIYLPPPVSARQHQSENAGARQQGPATPQLPTPGSSLSSPPLGQAMPGSRAASHGSSMSGGCGVATSQSLVSSVAKHTPGSGNQAQLFLQSLAAHERPAAEGMEQCSKSCSRLHLDSRAGRLDTQLLPGSDVADGGPHLVQGLPMCSGSVLSDSAAAPRRRAGESLPASRAASAAWSVAAGTGHAQRSALTTAAGVAQAAGRWQPGTGEPDRAAVTLGQTALGLGCVPACRTPSSPAVCAALWLYGTSQSQQPSAGLPTGGPLQPLTAAHALAAGDAANSACDCPDARPAQAKISGGPGGKRSAEAALAPGAGTAGSPEKRHRVQLGTAGLPAPDPQAARTHRKALAQPAPAAAPLPGPDARADTATLQPQQQHPQAGEQGGTPHSRLKPLAAGVSWYDLHRPSEQALSQQAERETVQWRLRHLQVTSLQIC